MNQAEVVHPGMVNRCEVGINLIASTEIDVKESLTLVNELDRLARGEKRDGHGPPSVELQRRK